MPRQKMANLFLWSGIALGACFLTFSCLMTFRSFTDWVTLKRGVARWEGKLHKPDDLLGYVPISAACGAVILPNGSRTSVCYDSQGLRSPCITSDKEIPTGKKDYLLALGCSFTFGFGVQAEDTFCNLVADKLKLTALNAGKCSAGMAEMLILARKLIPKFKPKIVLAQYSPWLAERSTHRYGPTVLGLLPHPYFVDSTPRTIKIHKPDFKSQIFDHGSTKIDLSDNSFRGFLNFSFSQEFPQLFSDKWNASLIGLKELTGLVPKPTKDVNRIEQYVYGEIASICRLVGSEMIVVVLGMDNQIPNVPNFFCKINLQVVNAQLAMIQKLEINSVEAYSRSYYHWGDEPVKVVDKHPNVFAHKTIADRILEVTRITIRYNTTNQKIGYSL
jgi:hypothetical protein